jgi:hypothetical protein
MDIEQEYNGMEAVDGFSQPIIDWDWGSELEENEDE